MRTRVAAFLAALLLVATGVGVAMAPASADPPVLDCWATIPTTNDCGYPNLNNTGLVDSTTPVTDIIETSSANQVIEDITLTGCIVVRHTGVVIHNVKVKRTTECAYAIDMNLSYHGSATISDVEIDCQDNQGTGIGDGGNYTATRVYVHNCDNGFNVGDNTTVEDSLIINTSRDTIDAHSDGIESQSGTGIVINHNTFGGWLSGTSAAIFDPTHNDDIDFTNNLMRGGAYTLYCPDGASDFNVTGNRFYIAGGARHNIDPVSPWGYTDACESVGTWSDNIVDSTGDTVNSDGSVS